MLCKTGQYGTVNLIKTAWMMIDGVRLQRKYRCSIEVLAAECCIQ